MPNRLHSLFFCAAFLGVLLLPHCFGAEADIAAQPVVQIASAAASPAAETVPIVEDPPGTVRLVGVETDIAKRYKFLVPPFPFHPFSSWRKWWNDNAISVHCALEWRDSAGQWHHGEMRSSKWDNGSPEHKVGIGQFPGTGYLAYGIFIFPGRVQRTVDELNRPVVLVLDEKINCDYKVLDYEIRKYGAYGKARGDPGTGNYGRENCGMGGPAYKPGQNSNTMINYVLRKAGVHYPAPDRAIGWDVEPMFPYSSESHFPKYDNQP